MASMERASLGLGVAAAGYALAVPVNFDLAAWPVAVLVACAAAACATAAWHLGPRGSAAWAAWALAGFAAARTLSALRGFSLGNDIFAWSAVAVAAGGAWAAWGAHRGPGSGPALRAGLALAGVGTLAIVAWQASGGAWLPALAGLVSVTGFLAAALSTAPMAQRDAAPLAGDR